MLERGSLRHTPAGVPVLEFRLLHGSEQTEAGVPRKVECELPCVAVGLTARLMTDTRPGDLLKVGGFLAAKSLRSRTPVLHVNTIEFMEGSHHGV